ncbi:MULTISPECIES: VWA domain-containing protein [Bacteroidota]|uniref:VWA domain-containing protein n=1 Tax=Flectobacillus rivi TaxID=2984209 RepID=A0ABT6Z1R1_9BACT|nr:MULTISPECIES: VWA domain-containing protein [Bacteroidota]MDI9874526.1 VWA domain-containing protein [Flectobacillus rivi]NBB28692.1 VWA domain-containing protein [Cellulophaga sp. BC115SP]
MEAWYSKYWFSIQTLSSFEWAQPFYLYCIPAIPFLFIIRNWIVGNNVQKLNVAFPAQQFRSSWISALRFVPGLLLVLSIMLILVALARPQRAISTQEEVSEGIDIMLALDISASMEATDIPPSRLGVARKVAKKFIEGRFQDRIGMVIFAGEPFSLCPLTNDYDMLKDYIDEIHPSLIATSGTALGNALGMCINRMREITSKSKVIILLSDGDNTAGNLDPALSAQMARAFGMKLYTIAVGSNKLNTEKVDESALRNIATIGNGKFFRATDARSLENIFKEINRLEKVEIKQNRYKNLRDFYHNYLRWAIMLLLLSFACKNTFMGNILED